MEQDHRIKKKVRKFRFPLGEYDSGNQCIGSGTDLTSDISTGTESRIKRNLQAKKKVQNYSFPLNQNNSSNQRIRPETDLDSDSFFFGARTQLIYDQLVQGLYGHSPLLVLTGPAGVGKTDLIHRISTHLSQDYRFIFAYNSYSSFEELVEPLCLYFGLGSANRTVLQLSKLLHECCDNAKKAGTRYIFVVDNGQDIAPEILFNLVVLVGIYKQNNASFQLLLAGRPSLEDKFQNADLKQIKQNSAIWVSLTNFDAVDVENFVKLLLETGSSKNDNPIREDVINKIAGYSMGNPRLIHALCNLALFSASLEDNKSITAETIDEAARQCMLTKAPVDKLVLKNRSSGAKPSIRNPKITSQSPSKPTYQFTNQVSDSSEYTTRSPEVSNRYHALNIPVSVGEENRQEQKEKIRDKRPVILASGKLLTKKQKIVSAIIFATILSVSFVSHDPEQTRSLGPTKSSIGAVVPKLESNGIQMSFLQKPEVKIDSSIGNEPTSEPKFSNANKSTSGLQLARALEKASMQMRKKHLTMPSDNNALQTYKQILSAYPGQIDARYGLLRIKRIYQKAGLKAELRGDLIRAKIFYSRALKAVPRDKVVITALNHVKKKLLYGAYYSNH